MPGQPMQASVRLDHRFLSVDSGQEVNAMLELSAPEAARVTRPKSFGTGNRRQAWPPRGTMRPGREGGRWGQRPRGRLRRGQDRALQIGHPGQKLANITI